MQLYTLNSKTALCFVYFLNVTLDKDAYVAS